MVDRGLLQRIVGALVLLALAVIFVPMLLTREDDVRQVAVDAPPMPETPTAPVIETEPVEVPQPAQEPFPEEYEIIEESLATSGASPDPIKPEPAGAGPSGQSPAAVASKPEVASQTDEPKRLDAASLPVSWSVQLASLSSRENAENLQKVLRSQGYNAYIRVAGGNNRVLVGPLIEKAEAERLRDQLNRQHKLNGFVVRFEPERS